MAREPVFANVYDLFDFSFLNILLTPFGYGAHHSGLQVYGKEYVFCGHDHRMSGVVEIEPRDYEDFVYKFRKQIFLGYTELSKKEVRNVLTRLAEDFKGCNYDMNSRNCNHFTDTFAKAICGKGIPRWVNVLCDTHLIRWLWSRVDRDGLSPACSPN